MARHEHPIEKRFTLLPETASKTALSVLLLGGLSCVGGFISADGAIAQTLSDDAAAVPSAQDLLAPVIQAQPLPPAPTTVAAPAPAAPVAPAPVVPTTSAIPSAPVVAPESSTIEFSAPKSATPDIAVPLAPSSAPHPINLSDLKADIPSANVDYGSSYIDTTDYSLGATSSPDIVITERSTGCKAVLQRGELPANVCGSGNSPVVAGGLSPNLPHGPRVALTPQSGQSAAFPNVNAIKIGPLSIGTNGIQVTRRLSVQDYYNRTERPKSLGGNNNTSLRFPLSIPAMVSSPFGWRIHPIFGTARMHTGTDLAAPQGTPIVAAYSGRVAISDFMGGYGLTVVIGHSEKSAETLYGHMSEVFVKAGEWVEQGDIIGRVGSTGNSTGPHLHFELRKQTENGWAVVNAGAFLQNGLAKIHEGFQLTEDFSIADARLVDPENGEVVKLSVPKVLQQGKYATKDDLSQTALNSLDASDEKNPVSSSMSVSTSDNAQNVPSNTPEEGPGDWVSPRELTAKDEDLAANGK
ncbi:MAG: M23 family metallopeptidase [Cyanobacteria bacterium P01_F01_bin.150]